LSSLFHFMRRISFYLLLLIAHSSITWAQEPGTKQPRPNIITILVDDMGFSDISCYGSEIPTPNLDALAAGGLRYKHCYNNARCCPTRASLLTGLYPHQIGIGHMAGGRQDENAFPGYAGRLTQRGTTAAEVLKQAGYWTCMVGKWHAGATPESLPAGRGFERSLNPIAGGFYFPDGKKADKILLNGEWVPGKGGQLPDQWYSSDLWTQFSLKFTQEAKDKSKPFYLYLAYNAPHFPLQAEAADIAAFRGKYKEGWDKLRTARHQRQKEMGLISDGWELPARPESIRAWDSLSEKEKDRFDHLMATYAACVSRMDRAVGNLIAGLKAQGQYENTLIFFLSDNGGCAETGPEGKTQGDPTQPRSNWNCGESWAFLQNTPFRRYKHDTHEGGIATPLIVHWPAGIQAKGDWRDEPVHLIDIVATAEAAAGVSHPTVYSGSPVLPLEGLDLRPSFEHPHFPPALERPLCFEHEGNAAIIQGRDKLVRHGQDGPWELYDLSLDRTEQHDLAAAEPEKAKKLLTTWQAWAQRTYVLPQPAIGKHQEGGDDEAMSEKNEARNKSDKKRRKKK
jgi:arylsulfatase A-like enzyme